MSTFKLDHIHGLDATCSGCDWARLKRAIKDSWSAETSADANWSPLNPALGQCAVTALVLQDVYGGELVRTTVGGVSHYFNHLPNGIEVDLTRQQFAEWEPTQYEVRTRDYVLSYTPTAIRHAALVGRVKSRLGGDGPWGIS